MKIDIEFLKSNNLILFEVIAGSKAFGLNTPTSDTDIRGVFYLPKEMYFGLEYIPQVANETNDIVYYELGRYVELLLKNNPNIMELIASPDDCVLYKHPLMERLSTEMFLSKLCKKTFGDYANAQIKKARGLNKKIVNPMDKVKKSLLDFCFILEENGSISLQNWLDQNDMTQEYCGLVNINHTKGVFALYYSDTNEYNGIVHSEIANEVCLSSIPKDEKIRAYMFFNLEYYSMYCKEYKEYWDWVKKRNNERYQSNQNSGSDYDAKNMMHTIRLLQVAEEILREGKLNVRRVNRDELLNIKSGKVAYEDLLIMAEDLMNQISGLENNSKLPDAPSIEKILKILVEMRRELYL
jgi:uncharacterized protein